jgi:hypothetical protein
MKSIGIQVFTSDSYSSMCTEETKQASVDEFQSSDASYKGGIFI